MSSWFEQIEAATSVTEVVAVARDYFSTWSPKEMALLPRSCRPGRVRGAEDIEELNANAVEAYRKTRASGDELTALQRLTGFLARAAVRIAELGELPDAQAINPASGRPRSRSSDR